MSRRSYATILALTSLTLAATLATGCAPTGNSASAAATAVAAPDPLNATYKLEKDTVTLSNGRSERPAAPGSASTSVTAVIEPRTVGDVDGDGRADTIVVLTQQPGGSGTFYYLSVLLNRATGVTAAPAALLGDRVTVKTVRLDGTTIVVDLLDRAAGEPMTTSPTVAKTKRFVVDAGVLKPQ